MILALALAAALTQQPVPVPAPYATGPTLLQTTPAPLPQNQGDTFSWWSNTHPLITIAPKPDEREQITSHLYIPLRNGTKLTCTLRNDEVEGCTADGPYTLEQVVTALMKAIMREPL